ncbi:hypothetical protein M1O50_06440 [Dehalococcoidia bacterium]|nr:hypothetical protein [Dehalococcoidia bacterium]
MAATGNVYENAMMESFFKTLKHKEVHLYEYETYHHVVTSFPISSRTFIIKRDFTRRLVTGHLMNLKR